MSPASGQLRPAGLPAPRAGTCFGSYCFEAELKELPGPPKSPLIESLWPVIMGICRILEGT